MELEARPPGGPAGTAPSRWYAADGLHPKPNETRRKQSKSPPPFLVFSFLLPHPPPPLPSFLSILPSILLLSFCPARLPSSSFSHSTSSAVVIWGSHRTNQLPFRSFHLPQPLRPPASPIRIRSLSRSKGRRPGRLGLLRIPAEDPPV